MVTSIQSNHKDVTTARKGEEVCLKIEPIPGESPKMFGRHFDETDIIMSKVGRGVTLQMIHFLVFQLFLFILLSQISRRTIDVCKQYFREDLQKEDWKLMIELKKLFEIL